MRLWEFDDDRAAPLNMVFEQDFILHIRRLNRLKVPHIVANIELGHIPADYGGRGQLEEAHRRLRNYAQSQKGFFAQMTNGDVFLTWPKTDSTEFLLEDSLKITLPTCPTHSEREKYMRVFNMPEDYTKVRERIEAYISPHRSTGDDKPKKAEDYFHLLQSDAARGELTAWTVNQMEHLVRDIDLHHFIRSQPIYYCHNHENWERLSDEAYIGLDEVRQKYFPHTDISKPKHLFLELCRVFDRKLFGALTLNYESVKGMKLNLNLSIPTILGLDFPRFVHKIDREHRANFNFELHCGDLMQDFDLTLNTLSTLKSEGFSITIDGLTPNMIEYFHFDMMPVDFVKINVSKDHAPSLDKATIQSAIQDISPSKVVFYRCDNELSIQKGLRLGISKYQGFLIDDLARRQIQL